MRRALITFAIMLAMVAPLLAGQTTPPPPPPQPAPAPQAKPATPRPPARGVSSQDLLIQMTGSGSYLGIEPREITADRVGPLKLKSERGVEVVAVDQDAPAGKAGLKEHDVILTFNGKTVESVEELKRLIRETPPGRTVALGISRDGQPMTINVQMGDRRNLLGLRGPMRMEIPRMPRMPEMPDIPSFSMLQFSGRNGILVEDLTPQLGDFFGAKNGEGVLVRSVEKGSPGEAAGLKAGDVIIRVGTERVADMGDWRRLMRGHQGETVALGIIRDKREQSLSLKIPPRRQSGASTGALGDWDIYLRGFHDEMERVRPELERLNKIAMVQGQREMALHRQDVERATQQARKELERAMQQHRQEMEKLQRDLQKMQEELRKDFQ